MRPMFSDHQVEIERSIQLSQDTPTSNFARFPEDFDLYELGEWDQTTSEFNLMKKPSIICNLGSLKREQEKTE